MIALFYFGNTIPFLLVYVDYFKGGLKQNKNRVSNYQVAFNPLQNFTRTNQIMLVLERTFSHANSDLYAMTSDNFLFPTLF